MVVKRVAEHEDVVNVRMRMQVKVHEQLVLLAQAYRQV